MVRCGVAGLDCLVQVRCVWLTKHLGSRCVLLDVGGFFVRRVDVWSGLPDAALSSFCVRGLLPFRPGSITLRRRSDFLPL